MGKLKKVDKWFVDGAQYVLWLECGHIYRIKRVMSDETDDWKPPPKRMKCKHCEHGV